MATKLKPLYKTPKIIVLPGVVHGACSLGSQFDPARCKAGYSAGGNCQPGSTADADCKNGATVVVNCKQGTNP